MLSCICKRNTLGLMRFRSFDLDISNLYNVNVQPDTHFLIFIHSSNVFNGGISLAA